MRKPASSLLHALLPLITLLYLCTTTLAPTHARTVDREDVQLERTVNDHVDLGADSNGRGGGDDNGGQGGGGNNGGNGGDGGREQQPADYAEVAALFVQIYENVNGAYYYAFIDEYQSYELRYDRGARWDWVRDLFGLGGGRREGRRVRQTICALQEEGPMETANPCAFFPGLAPLDGDITLDSFRTVEENMRTANRYTQQELVDLMLPTLSMRITEMVSWWNIGFRIESRSRLMSKLIITSRREFECATSSTVGEARETCLWLPRQRRRRYVMPYLWMPAG